MKFQNQPTVGYSNGADVGERASRTNPHPTPTCNHSPPPTLSPKSPAENEKERPCPPAAQKAGESTGKPAQGDQHEGTVAHEVLTLWEGENREGFLEMMGRQMA